MITKKSRDEDVQENMNVNRFDIFLLIYKPQIAVWNVPKKKIEQKKNPYTSAMTQLFLRLGNANQNYSSVRQKANLHLNGND